MGSLSRRTKADQFSYVPAGTVLPFAGDTAPSGWAICNGDPVSRTDYPELFTAIGELWGVGDGSTTFNLPDMRGQFLRGKDYGRHLIDGEGNPDGDLDVGTQQTDGLQSFTPVAGRPFSTGSTASGRTYYNEGGGTVPSVIDWDATATTPDSAANGQGFIVEDLASGAGAPRLGQETRAKNVTVNYIIKL